MSFTAITIPFVDPMMVRRFTPITPIKLFGGVLIIERFDIEEIGLAEERLDFDTDVVDCSNRIFEITNFLMMLRDPVDFCCFPSRRWRNLRSGLEIERLPDAATPLLFIGNPIRLTHDSEALVVNRTPEYRIKSGPELGY